MKIVDNIARKMVTKYFFDQVLSKLESEKARPQLTQKYLDVFNSGVLVDLERIRKLSIDLAIKTVQTVKKNYETNTKGTL